MRDSTVPDDDSWEVAPDAADPAAPAASPPPDPGGGLRLAPGAHFGPYVIAGELGRGGMGVVYRAAERETGREVALKLITRATARHRERFRREGELTAALRHSGIVRVHSAGDVDGVPYLAYELVEGSRTLGEVLPDLPQREVLALLRDVARAVGHAHAGGVVHRDLKPDNVLIDADGRPRVADFGLALGAEDGRLTATGALVGTPATMAPEQLAADREAIGPATDVWALGVMLYQGLTGELPFVARNLVELSAMVWNREPTPLRRLDRTVPAAVEAICSVCLAKLPADRYPDARALADDLDRALAGDSVSGLARRAARRGRGVAAWVPALALAVAALALAALGPVGSDGSASARDGAELRRTLTAFRAGRRPATALRQALGVSHAAPAALRCEAWLALAATTGVAPEVRVGDADRALALAPGSRRAQALRLRGEALLAADRAAEAAEAFAAARAAGDRRALRDEALALERAGRSEEALAACRARLAEDPGDAQATQQAVGLLLAAGRREEATRVVEALRQRMQRGPVLSVLEAELAFARGADGRDLLEQAARTWPRSPAPALALARLLVDRGDVRPCLARLDALGEEAAPEVAALRTSLAAVVAGSAPDPPLPARWRRPIARWLLRQGEREWAFVERRAHPLAHTSPGALDTATRIERARRWWTAAAAHAEPGSPTARAARTALAAAATPGSAERAARVAEALAAGEPSPRLLLVVAEEALAQGNPEQALARLGALGDGSARGHELRGRAYARLGRLDLARAELEAAAGDDCLDVELVGRLIDVAARQGDAAGQARWQDRLEALRGERREQAAALLVEIERARAADQPVSHLVDMIRRASAADPLSLEARYLIAHAHFMRADTARSAELRLELAGHVPARYAGFYRSVLAFNSPFNRTGLASDLFAELAGGSSLGQLRVRGFLGTVAVEQQGRQDLVHPVLAILDEWIEREPGCAIAWLLRSSIHLRLGRVPEAERDLDVAREEAADNAFVDFYGALLLAARRASADLVRAALGRARAKGFDAWAEHGWRGELFAEMEPYRAMAGFEPFRPRPR